MELNEISVQEGIVGQIDPEGPFADIAVVMDNRDRIYSNVNPDASYEDTLDEINMERARYLVNTDEIIEEKFGQIQA